ncbi:MAG: crossover junction endodeoxyribonuclease RuvC [Patescibacteria group bacterium]|nr:crossover junction endodeoxyribonuclease RuvC [Patescibacteria group bacterium]
MIILGIDPGSTHVGFGLILTKGQKLFHLKSGLLNIPKEPKSSRLLSLEEDLKKILDEFKPERVGVEKLFFVKNKKTAFEVAESRGVIINTLAKHNLKLFEVYPSEVKLALTGNGSANKNAVAKMVSFFLRLPKKLQTDDVSDALAIAITISRKQ